MSHKDYKKLPIIYSCSGCSSAAQLANDIAIKFDHQRIAEMSCIVGVGGNVNSLVSVAQSGREIIALDGCGLNCVKNTLAERGVTPDRHFTLTDMGAKKRYHKNYTEDEKEQVTWKILEQISLAGEVT